MKQTLKKITLLTAALLFISAVFSAQALTPSFTQKNTKGEIDDLGTFKTSKNKESAESKIALESDKNFQQPTSGLDSGQPQKRYYLQAAPDDPYYNNAWHLTAVNAPSAWDITTGSTSVTVAVIDSGFALAHEDLVPHWKYNMGEYGDGKESDGIDSDGNGYIDDFRGWNFVPETYLGDPGNNIPQAGAENPAGSGVSHGTEVAGLVGAVGNNGLGTTAVSQSVSVMPLQVVSDNGEAWTDDVAEAIYYAVDNGADVVNISLGTLGDDPVVRAVIDYAYANNVVVVAAAGNCGNAGTGGPCLGQPPGYITFPASYNRVIAVGATTSTGVRSSFSSYGQRLDVVAPGSGNIVSPTWTSVNGNSAYKTQLHGTSFASPITASGVALIRSIRSESSVDDIRALIMAGAHKLDGMSGSFYTQQLGHGILDVTKMAEVASELNVVSLAQPKLVEIDSLRPIHDAGTWNLSMFACETEASAYCTVSFTNQQSNYQRFLPYRNTNGTGNTSWTWAGSILAGGEWLMYARKGDILSDPLEYYR